MNPHERSQRAAASRSLLYLLPVLALLMVAGCGIEEAVMDRFRGETPHEKYLASLERAGLGESALARRWIGLSDAAFQLPVEASLPMEEHGRFDASEPTALSYRIALVRGERFEATLHFEDVDEQLFANATVGTGVPRTGADQDPDPETGTDETGIGADALGDAARGHTANVFMELYRLRESEGDGADIDATAILVASPDPEDRALVYEARATGTYLLRIQPELFAEGPFRVVMRSGASLAFPVEAHGTHHIQSVFGDARDGGARDHHGVDIFAPRGTPVLAASHGRASRVRETPVGGKVVWVSDGERGISQYYAHLDSQTVQLGARVSLGDTLGFVGNTGNAISTPPHLHFGIYARGSGAVDPWPYLYESDRTPAPLDVRPDAFRSVARANAAGLELRRGPAASAPVVPVVWESGSEAEASRLLILGGTGAWYRVRTGDGVHGYVRASEVTTVPREPPSVPGVGARLSRTVF